MILTVCSILILLVRNKVRGGSVGSINLLSEGLRSIYALSFLEAYIEEEDTLSCIIMIEDPEIYLHPQLQKVASEILYRLSKKNQVLFTTHSPNLIFNFSTKQIREIILDEEYYTIARQDTDIDVILDDLGYTANDLMNVSFVFIVEGKQDSNRLPLLLEKIIIPKSMMMTANCSELRSFLLIAVQILKRTQT